MLQDEYYIISRENNDDYPLVSWDESRGSFGLGEPVNFDKSIKLRLSDPISPNFKWVDYHSLPKPVVSKLIAEQLYSLKLYRVQLVPADIRNPKDPFAEVKKYWFIHICNRIACLNKEKSELELYDDGTIFGIEKLILNEEVLKSIELNKRLIFELSEKNSVLLVHQSVKDVIESLNPKGCRFFKATEWYSDIVFD